MKRKSFLIIISLLLAAVTMAHAEVITDYNESFEGLDVSNKDFHPKGWAHHYYTSSYYSYNATYTLTDGGKSGQYLIVSQKYPNYTTYDDLLISPAVTGRVSLWVKSSGTAASVKFYKMTQSSTGAWTKAEEITPDVAPSLTENFQEYVFNNIAEATRIGIRGHQVGFDDFSAESAEVVLKTSLKIGETSTTALSAVDFDGTNSYGLVISVPLTNNGERDLNSGDDKFSLTLRAGSLTTSMEIATVAAADNIAVGESKTRDYTFTIDGSKINGTHSLYLFENISGTSNFVKRITFNPYMAKFVMRDTEGSGTSSVVSSGTTQNFGSVKTDTTRTFYIYNEGTAPLVLDIAISEGFETSLPTGTVIAAKQHEQIAITMKADSYGTKNGLLTIKGNDMDDFTMNLQGIVLDPEVWFEGFESGSLPADMTASQQWEFKADNGGYAFVASSTVSRLTTPKLTVGEGQTITLRIAKHSYSAWQTPTLKVFKLSSRGDEGELIADFSSEAEYGLWKTVTIDDVAAGECYLAINGAYIDIDEIYGFKKTFVAHDLMVTAQSLPATGEVNSAMKASMTVRNLGPTEIAGSYKAQLLINEAVAAEADAVEMEQSSTVTFNFNHTPHAAGENMPIAIRLVSNADNEVMASSEDATLTIKEETGNAETTVGTVSSATGYRSPIYTYDKYSWTDIVYPAEKIGIETGARISKLSFKGKNSTDLKAANIKVWIENTDVAAAPSKWSSQAENPAVELSDYVFPVTADGDVLVIDMGEKPFTYGGGNLRIRLKKTMDTPAGKVSFFIDNAAGSAAYNYDSTDKEEPSLYNTKAPVVSLSLIADPMTVKGSVTDKHSKAAIKDAEVVVKSGNIEYYGKTGEDGTYSINVLKKLSGYSVNVNLESYFPYSGDIAFTAGEYVHNITLTEAKDLYVVASDIPAEGMVNHEYVATIDLKNVNNDTFKASRYTAELYFGDELMAAAQTKDIGAGNTERLFFRFTPHADVISKARLVINWDEITETTDEADVKIVKEVATGTVRVGTPTDNDNSFAPVFMNWKASASETVYDKNGLNIGEGSKILSISYRGYTSNNHNDVAFKVWLQNTDDAAGSVGSFNRESMTLVYDATKSIEAAGSSIETVELLKFDLTTPFVYTGGNLRVIVQEVRSDFASAFFECDNTMYNATAYERAGDEATLLSGGSFSDKTHSPVMYLTYDNYKKIEGVVTDASDNQPIENVTVTAVSGEVIYTATTNSEGRYSIGIVQHDREYSLNAAAESYFPAEPVCVTLNEGDVEHDFALTRLHYILSGSVTDKATGMPIEGAEIKAVSGETEYLATTDDEGKYQIAVYVINATYEVTASAGDMYRQETKSIEIADGDVVADFELTDWMTLNIYNATIDFSKGDIFDIHGRKMTRGSSLPRGIYIQNGKKFIVK
ncbi:MAG: carboxypeptidase regulatory-like domain-containing protein [Prevotella sp.]|uniref:carboxypeptidase regulatory-like domain-containing protein n=1 Tax=Prevotella sp. TaxID=59823 RepID=UPI002A29CBCF|nr:carboxypeptidase regulatory-like domain-containing protein [Prevotella sp.]MDD7318423.1 carboxypeptidase regulatory-like domain-containing protein [Prevotellaceae bacterium]MDY4020226.1 carboxypeptidase regulatory-like domain-containing protein [Prevotella sp.]